MQSVSEQERSWKTRLRGERRMYCVTFGEERASVLHCENTLLEVEILHLKSKCKSSCMKVGLSEGDWDNSGYKVRKQILEQISDFSVLSEY